MEDVLKIASYICHRFKVVFKYDIDEMKLHKLLYFTQRECIIQKDTPMFEDQFEAWKYGPVMRKVHLGFKSGVLSHYPADDDLKEYKSVFDKIFTSYAPKKSWSLSMLTHGEYSWKKAREGYAPDEHCEVEMKTSDIYIDARRIKQRRAVLQLMGKSL